MPRKRKRNYRAEYKRRIERALKYGYSRSVARGHPKTIVARGKDGKVLRDRKGKPHRKHVEMGIKAARFLGEKPGTLFRDILKRDAQDVFGEVPRRGRDDFSPPRYQLRLEELAERDGRFDWTNEGEFIRQMTETGLTQREAYSTWFGYPP